jgi:zinc D-Ala-D-Ala carboxypeptidase
MTYTEPARTTPRRIRSVLVAGLQVVVNAFGYRLVRIQHRGALGEADGAVPDGTTVFDDEVPGVAKLDPAFLGALRQAAKAAAADGVVFHVNSGWRSPAYQNQLLREAVTRYGSAAEAARWVATPDTSAHVSGDAVDIGPAEARAWLAEHGADYGLCQIYRNEPWHYELRPEAVEHGCPPMYADQTQDPRMHY